MLSELSELLSDGGAGRVAGFRFGVFFVLRGVTVIFVTVFPLGCLGVLFTGEAATALRSLLGDDDLRAGVRVGKPGDPRVVGH